MKKLLLLGLLLMGCKPTSLQIGDMFVCSNDSDSSILVLTQKLVANSSTYYRFMKVPGADDGSIGYVSRDSKTVMADIESECIKINR